jgi:hypothetical protein
MTLCVGDILMDNDPRMPNRGLHIVALNDEFAYCLALHSGRECRIRRDRIYTDGKPRRGGFTRVKRAGEP